MDFLIFLYEWR